MTQTVTNCSLADNNSLTRLSPAKINLFLHITGKRADGYHNLQTVFRLLDWGDYLQFTLTDMIDTSNAAQVNTSIDQQAAALTQQLINLKGAASITDNVADNLIFKAAKALLAYVISIAQLPHSLHAISITLDKHLPMGAGLGGGSSNAATTLLALNELWQLNLNQDELITIATTIGADVPIFIFGQDAIAMGIGEELTSIDLPNQHYLILTPNAHVNTAELFAHPTLNRDIAPLSTKTITHQSRDYLSNLNSPYQNVFTPVVISLAPAVEEALSYLQGLEADTLGTARMTGSGSAVFLPLDASVAADKALLVTWIESAPCAGYVVESL
ncbi:4-(cytidine 5'-diphospho)-2-C-methyl-D-erythritol kinase [uncultured Psychrobacter sp.]|uniref:4-(cytidine 5'-diphospho)-2-C-methyl-D-erythritol kinase n=1 Tax=uncultured Psychrobacter sp. TaxID=259303 RepID=UPI002607B43A|nr:4-(cytidine 5'-diphospho)-2-C-methyl-D-erythritol kinase [uncultured Psychrobacter sp.]